MTDKPIEQLREELQNSTVDLVSNLGKMLLETRAEVMELRKDLLETKTELLALKIEVLQMQRYKNLFGSDVFSFNI